MLLQFHRQLYMYIYISLHSILIETCFIHVHSETLGSGSCILNEQGRHAYNAEYQKEEGSHCLETARVHIGFIRLPFDGLIG